MNAIIVPPAAIRYPYFCDCACMFILNLAFLFFMITTNLVIQGCIFLALPIGLEDRAIAADSKEATAGADRAVAAEPGTAVAPAAESKDRGERVTAMRDMVCLWTGRPASWPVPP